MDSVSGVEPETYNQAVGSPDSSRWKEAINNEATKHVFRFLRGTLHLGIQYRSDGGRILGLQSYSDVDWGEDCDTPKVLYEDTRRLL